MKNLLRGLPREYEGILGQILQLNFEQNYPNDNIGIFDQTIMLNNHNDGYLRMMNDFRNKYGWLYNPEMFQDMYLGPDEIYKISGGEYNDLYEVKVVRSFLQ